MTLSEIETILEELVVRHKNLNTELLATLLQSAGWEDKNIKDALMLFKQRSTTLPQPQVASALSSDIVQQATVNPPQEVVEKKKEDLTFYESDGAEEKELHEFPEVDTVRKKEEKEEPLLSGVTITLPAITATSPTPTEEIKKIPQTVPEKPKEPTTVPSRKEEVETRVVHTEEKGESFLAKIGILLPSFVITEPVRKSSLPVFEEGVPIIKPPVLEKIKESPPLPPRIVQEVEQLTGERGVPSNTPPKASVISEKAKIVQPLENVHVNIQPTPPLVTTNEPQSLITHEEILPSKITKKQAQIPEDLPLLPFESSPHVWPFSRYKDVFHGEVMSEKIPKVEVEKEVVVAKSTPIITKPRVVPANDVEIDLEKTPMTKGDESLVFLAGVMLFVIILILGYMYSNGRL